MRQSKSSLGGDKLDVWEVSRMVSTLDAQCLKKAESEKRTVNGWKEEEEKREKTKGARLKRDEHRPNTKHKIQSILSKAYTIGHIHSHHTFKRKKAYWNLTPTPVLLLLSCPSEGECVGKVAWSSRLDDREEKSKGAKELEHQAQ